MSRRWGSSGFIGEIRQVVDLEATRRSMGCVNHVPQVGNVYIKVAHSGDGFYDFVQVKNDERDGVKGWVGVEQDRIGGYGHMGQKEIRRIVPKKQLHLLQAGGVFVPLTDIPFPSDLPETVG